jgi:glutathione peroxidase
MPTTEHLTAPFLAMDGTSHTLNDYAGRVVLVVNVASKCGLTPQYEGLQALFEARQDQGLVVVGFPANNFLEQEPGTDAEIAEFCSLTYNVTFPVMSKISVAGADQHPLYAALTVAVPEADGKAAFRENLTSHGIEATQDPDVLWNFEKFLIGRDGSVRARFAPTTTPDDPAFVEALDQALADA